MRDIIPSACPGSAQESIPEIPPWVGFQELWQMPGPPQRAPLDVEEEQRLYSKLFLGAWLSSSPYLLGITFNLEEASQSFLTENHGLRLRASPHLANRTTSFAKNKTIHHGPQNTGLWMRLEILSIKIMNKLVTEGNPHSKLKQVLVIKSTGS